MIRMIMKLVQNQNFTLTTSDSKQNRLHCLKNGVSQGSVVAPLLFNIYTYDLPFMISRKFAYADNLAFLHSSGNWKDLEGTLSQDMSTLSAYLQTWRLKLSHTKIVTAAFHLNNQEAKRELKVYNNNRQRCRYLERHPLQVRHKQDWGRGFILLLPQTAAMPGSDAGSDTLDSDHILYGLLSGSSDTRHVRLRFRCPFVPAVQNLLDNLARLGICTLNGQTTNRKQSTAKMFLGSVSLCPGLVPGLLGWVYPEQLGLSSTACGLVLGNSIRPCTDGVLLLHQIVSVVPLNNLQTMF